MLQISLGTIYMEL